MSETRTTDCAGCGRELTYMAPAPDQWDAINEVDVTAGPSKQMKTVAWRLVIACSYDDCNARTELRRVDDPRESQ